MAVQTKIVQRSIIDGFHPTNNNKVITSDARKTGAWNKNRDQGEHAEREGHFRLSKNTLRLISENWALAARCANQCEGITGHNSALPASIAFWLRTNG